MDAQIVDTGALVALLDRADKWHLWAAAKFQSMRPPLVTCEAVITETWHLFKKDPRGQHGLMKLCAEEVLKIEFCFEKESATVWRLVEKYADTPMDFADACLVRMTELLDRPRVWTVDTDFQVYRRFGRLPIPLLYPE